jgi:hypothetical protein
VVPTELSARGTKKTLENDVMNSIKQAQGGNLTMMALGLAFALTVNAAFGYGLAKASTNGQRIYDAWNNTGGTMMAYAGAVQHRLCNKG